MSYVSAYHPPEVRTPPLPLVAFVGCPEYHKDLGSFLSTALRPPLVSLGVADATDPLLHRIFGALGSPASHAL